jgi:hypothetical protein
MKQAFILLTKPILNQCGVCFYLVALRKVVWFTPPLLPQPMTNGLTAISRADCLRR